MNKMVNNTQVLFSNQLYTLKPSIIAFFLVYIILHTFIQDLCMVLRGFRGIKVSIYRFKGGEPPS